MKSWLCALAAVLVLWSGPLSARLALLRVDLPDTSLVPQSFVIEGMAIGADVVHVWAWPVGSDPVFLGWSTTDHIDTLRKLPTGDFRVLVTGAPLGTYPIVVYGHDVATNTFPVQLVAVYTVRPCVWQVEDWPFASPSGLPTFVLLGPVCR